MLFIGPAKNYAVFASINKDEFKKQVPFDPYVSPLRQDSSFICQPYDKNNITVAETDSVLKREGLPCHASTRCIAEGRINRESIPLRRSNGSEE